MFPLNIAGYAAQSPRFGPNYESRPRGQFSSVWETARLQITHITVEWRRRLLRMKPEPPPICAYRWGIYCIQHTDVNGGQRHSSIAPPGGNTNNDLCKDGGAATLEQVDGRLEEEHGCALDVGSPNIGICPAAILQSSTTTLPTTT